MKLSEIQELMRSFDSSGLTGLELMWDGVTLRMQKGAAPLPVGGAAPAAPGAEAAPAPRQEAPAGSGAVEVKAPIVKEGQRVEKGQTLCLLEAMKMMNQVEAPAAGVVRKIRFRNGELAQFGDVLVELEPEQ